jgi:hypothetical protein
MSERVLAPVRNEFRALAVAIVPASAALADAEWDELEAIVERALASRPARMRRQLALFVRLLTVAPLLRHGRRFPSLGPAAQARFLGAVERSPLLLLRRGFWGLRTLVYMGFYGRPAAAAVLGYRAHVLGWEWRSPARASNGGAPSPAGSTGESRP